MSSQETVHEGTSQCQSDLSKTRLQPQMPRPVMVDTYANALYLLDHPSDSRYTMRAARQAAADFERFFRGFEEGSSQALYFPKFKMAAVRLAGIIDNEKTMRQHRLKEAVEQRDLMLHNVHSYQRVGAIVLMVMKIASIAGLSFLLTKWLLSNPWFAERMGRFDPSLVDPGLVARIAAIVFSALFAVLACSLRYRRNRKVSELFRKQEAEIISRYIHARREATNSAIRLLCGAWEQATGAKPVEYAPAELTLASLELESLDMSNDDIGEASTPEAA